MAPSTFEELLELNKVIRWATRFSKICFSFATLCEVSAIPLGLYAFHRRWQWEAQSHGRSYWRPGIVWGLAISLWKPVFALLMLYLPDVLRASGDLAVRLSSLGRRTRKSLLHRTMQRRGTKKVDNKSIQVDEDGERYEYELLDPSDKEIRLLTLHPGSDSDEVRVDISYASLHDRPQYLAISYVWGDATKMMHPIRINGRTHHVARNLLHALQHLRNMRGPDSELTFWIDALCIDQDDDNEKSHQVVLMREIYSQAYKILVWLGPPSEESELLLARLRAMEAHLYLLVDWDKGEREQPATDVDIETVRFRDCHDYYEPTFFENDSNDPRRLHALSAIANLMENPWWQRAWIAQEVSSLRSHSTDLGNVEIIMGRQLQVVSFRSTVKLLALVMRLGEDAYEDSRLSTMVARVNAGMIHFQRLNHITRLRHRYMPISQKIARAIVHALGRKRPGPTTDQLFWARTVRPLVERFRQLKSSNPRDRVYAALPLALPSNHPAFAPNYELSVPDVYSQMAVSFIQHEGSLSVLSDCSLGSTEIPSWVPDYRQLRLACPLSTLLDAHYRPIYHASGELKVDYSVTTEQYRQEKASVAGAEIHDPSENTVSRNILTIQGVALDRVKALSQGPRDQKEATTIRRPHWEALLAQLLTHYAPSNEPTTTAYQRTIRADLLRKTTVKEHEDFNTSRSRIFAALGTFERYFIRLMHRPKAARPSYNVLQIMTDVNRRAGDIETLEWWERSCDNDEAFFTRPEPPEYPNTDSLSQEEKTKAYVEHSRTRHVRDIMKHATANRGFCITEKGYMGLVPIITLPGDMVVVLFGGYTPFVLREVEPDGPKDGRRRWKLIGECYMHGFMDGEALEGLDQDGSGVTSEVFVLV